MINELSRHRVEPPSRAQRIIPLLSGIAICALALSLIFAQPPADNAADAPADAEDGVGLRGSFLSDIGPHLPSAFQPRGRRVGLSNIFVTPAIAAATANAPAMTTAQAPTPPERPAELRNAAVEAEPFDVDAPTPPRRPAEFSLALRPEPPREETASEPAPQAAPRQSVRLERTIVAPAPPAEHGSFFSRIFGAAPQAQNRAPQAMAYAAAADEGGLFGGLHSAVAPANPASRFDRFTAVYDISARVVYLPDGTRLEAHSGLREHLDDPRYVHLRMRGPTPPHVYDLTPREKLFHGVEALRLNPVGGENAIYGRAGLLAHTFMLGPNGDSNGCVSFRNYGAFLQAYKRGLIRRLAVVAHL